jgi:hypothetical protein
MSMSEELFYHLLERVEELEVLKDDQHLHASHYGHLGPAEDCQVARCQEERKKTEEQRGQRREEATKLWLGQKV